MSKLAGLRVLLVGCSDSVAEAIRIDGHRVVAHDNHHACLREARDTILDVVVLDLDMPGPDPFDLAKNLRAVSRWRKPMFLALAERGDAPLATFCLDAGIDLLLVKPVELGQLAGFLHRLQTIVEEQESFDPVI